MEKADVDINEVRDLLKTAKGRAKSDFAKKFVADQEERLKKYGDDTWFSEKQMAVLRKIAGEETKTGEAEYA